MNGAIPPLPQYAFLVWCSVKAQRQLPSPFYSPQSLEFVCVCVCVCVCVGYLWKQLPLWRWTLQNDMYLMSFLFLCARFLRMDTFPRPNDCLQLTLSHVTRKPPKRIMSGGKECRRSFHLLFILSVTLLLFLSLFSNLLFPEFFFFFQFAARILRTEQSTAY